MLPYVTISHSLRQAVRTVMVFCGQTSLQGKVDVGALEGSLPSLLWD